MSTISTQPQAAQAYCAGIDVAEEKLDVHFGTGHYRVYENSVEGCAALVADLQSRGIRRVALEATGASLHLPCARAAEAAGMEVDVAHAFCVHRFAQAGRAAGAKTDRTDARVLCVYAGSSLFRPRPVETPEQQALRELHARRTKLVELRADELKRLKQVGGSGCVYESISESIAFLAVQIERVDGELASQITNSEELKEKRRRLDTAPGVAEETASSLIVNLPELGTLTGREISSLAGLAPHRCESGQWKGKARIGGGRRQVRRTLYMAVMGALRAKADSPVKDIYNRVLARNPGRRKVAHIAAMHKLLTILNAMIKYGRDYIPAFENPKKGARDQHAA